MCGRGRRRSPRLCPLRLPPPAAIDFAQHASLPRRTSTRRRARNQRAFANPIAPTGCARSAEQGQLSEGLWGRGRLAKHRSYHRKGAWVQKRLSVSSCFVGVGPRLERRASRYVPLYHRSLLCRRPQGLRYRRHVAPCLFVRYTGVVLCLQLVACQLSRHTAHLMERQKHRGLF